MNINKQRIDKILELTKGPKVLDLGCIQHNIKNTKKDVWLHAKICNNFNMVVGVDILEKEVTQLQDEGYNIYCDNVESLDAYGWFNTIVIGELIEHLANPGLMIENLSKNLLNNGQIIITTPNPWYIKHIQRQLFDNLHNVVNPEHTCWYDIITLEQLFNRYNYKLIHYEYVCETQEKKFIPLKYLRNDIFTNSTLLCIFKKGKK